MEREQIESLTIEKLTVRMKQEKLGIDSVSKSLRCYDTFAHPLLLERLATFWTGLDKTQNKEGDSFTYTTNVAGMTGSFLLNYCFQSFYEQEPQEWVEVVYPRTSNNTSVQISNLDGQSMRNELTNWLKSYTTEGCEVVSLRQLAGDELGRDVVDNLMSDFLHSDLALSIESLLKENDYRIPCDRFVTVASRHLPHDLYMKTRYYPSRDDFRAYCTDHNRLRSLVASCLNRMVAPKSMRTRKRLHTAKILRPEKKDAINLRITTHTCDKNYGTFLVLADISNFTGSFGNSWLMTFVMALEIANGRLKDKHQLMSIGSQLFEVSWKELLILYLYLTVGVPCWVTEQSRLGYLSGGFLGVGGNMSIGLLTLCWVLEDCMKRLRTDCMYSTYQAGGDDIAIAITCRTNAIEGVTYQIRHELASYVGHVKEFQVIDLMAVNTYILRDAVFCKKRIRYEKFEKYIHLSAEPSVPLPDSLFPDHTIRRWDKQVEAWHELDNGLRQFETEMPGHEVLADTLRFLFIGKYPYVIPRRTQTRKFLDVHHKVIHTGSFYTVTDIALERAMLVPSVEYRGIVAIEDLESKLRHALVCKILTMVTVSDSEGHKAKVIMTPRESHKLRVVRTREICHLLYCPVVLEKLRKIVIV
jgi:hypothetical protein